MQGTNLNTISVPAVGTINPATIINAGQVPLRLLIRNIGPVLLFLGTDTESLASPGGPSTGVYRLPAGETDVFVLAPKQGMYAVASGIGGLVTTASSEALPIDLQP